MISIKKIVLVVMACALYMPTSFATDVTETGDVNTTGAMTSGQSESAGQKKTTQPVSKPAAVDLESIGTLSFIIDNKDARISNASLKESILGHLELAHRQGLLLDLTKEDIEKLTDEEIMMLVSEYQMAKSADATADGIKDKMKAAMTDKEFSTDFSDKTDIKDFDDMDDDEKNDVLKSIRNGLDPDIGLVGAVSALLASTGGYTFYRMRRRMLLSETEEEKDARLSEFSSLVKEADEDLGDIDPQQISLPNIIKDTSVISVAFTTKNINSISDSSERFLKNSIKGVKEALSKEDFQKLMTTAEEEGVARSTPFTAESSAFSKMYGIKGASSKMTKKELQDFAKAYVEKEDRVIRNAVRAKLGLEPNSEADGDEYEMPSGEKM